MEIAPTHTCFDDALDYLEELARRGASWQEIVQYTIVHGICTAPDGQHYAHAWLEFGGNAWQGGILEGQRIYFAMPLQEFRACYGVVDETRYSLSEACDENARTGTYGPWVDRYRALVAESDYRVWKVEPMWLAVEDEREK